MNVGKGLRTFAKIAVRMQTCQRSCFMQHPHIDSRHASSGSADNAPIRADMSRKPSCKTVSQYCRAAKCQDRASIAHHSHHITRMQHHGALLSVKTGSTGRTRQCETRALSLSQHSDLSVWTILSVCAAAAQVAPLKGQACSPNLLYDEY